MKDEEIVLDDGRKAVREVVEHPGSAAIVPFITEDEILLIQQYRHAVKGKPGMKFPAGTLNAGESFVTWCGA